jgi:hypothetical protein
MAQEKLAAEGERTSHAPRNPAYYLKQLFTCGHCGKSLVPRKETSRTGRRTIVYCCSTYLRGRQNGHPTECGYQRITHEDAERLLREKIEEMSLSFDENACGSARENLETQLDRLGEEDDEARERWWEWLSEGVDAFLEYLRDAGGVKGKPLQVVETAAMEFYRLGGKLSYRFRDKLPMALADFKKAVRAAETATIKEAERQLARLREEHHTMTLNWSLASLDMQAVLKPEIERRPDEIRDLEPRTVPLSERFKRLHDAEAERRAERKRLESEWQKLGEREKGEALRRLFHTVELFWDRAFHPARLKPTRPRKTDREGRFSYTLRRDRIKWHFAATDSAGSS